MRLFQSIPLLFSQFFGPSPRSKRFLLFHSHTFSSSDSFGLLRRGVTSQVFRDDFIDVLTVCVCCV